MDESERRILIVDDDPAMRRLLRHILSRDDSYAVRAAGGGERAIEIAAVWPPDLVLLDITMPGMDGYETCAHLKSFSLPDPPQVIMVSGRSEVEEQSRAFEQGADDYLVKPVDPSELRSRVALHFRLRESQLATRELQSQVESHHLELRQAATEQRDAIIAAQDAAVFTLAKVAESRDNETGEHLIRLRAYTGRLAEELRHDAPFVGEIDSRFLSDLYRSSPLHDIGKVGIPDAILLKPGKLTVQEFEIMKRHTIIGANILNEAVMQLKGGGFLSMAAAIAQSHHEKWDGSGYPAGLVAEEIPLPARIVAVADVFDALTSERPYKLAWPAARARETILEDAGTHFDPAIAAAFERCFDDFLRIQQDYVDQETTVTGAMAFREFEPADVREFEPT